MTNIYCYVIVYMGVLSIICLLKTINIFKNMYMLIFTIIEIKTLDYFFSYDVIRVN